MTTLLGHLARFASFSAQSEVLCTQGLAYLLDTHQEARLVRDEDIRQGRLFDTGFVKPVDQDEEILWIACATE